MLHSQHPICALIPTYNNAGTIIDVLRRVHKYMRDIIVVNDGCTDDTLALLALLDFPITIVTHERNKGKGRALVSGFRKAIEMGFEYALTLDADGQHYPEDIPVMMHALDLHQSAIIVGSRQFTDENMDGKSRFANRFSNFWFRLQTTVNLPDTQTGMRIYPLHQLYGLHLITSRYEAELELLVFAAWRNVPLVPVPIRVYYPPKEQRVSHFRPAYDFTRISILNCFLCLGALLFGYINMYWRTILCFGYFGLTMLLLVTPYTLLYFAVCGETPESRLRYRLQMQRLAKHYCLLLSGLHYTIDNPQNIRLGEQPSVIISNHQSHIDIMLILSQTPKMAIMVKDYIWNNPIFHTVARKLDCFPLSLDEEAKQTLIRRVTDEGYSLMVFPEGTRTTTGEIGRFHRGAAYYAHLLQLPVQPLLLEGMCDYLSRRQFAIKPNNVTLHILPLIPHGDVSFGRDYKRRTKSLELYYSALLHSNRTEIAILGAGVGGLFAGALLAKEGYLVTLFEQLPVYGGGLYSYERNGETWLTGMHILSGLEPDGPVTKILSTLDLKASITETILDNNPDQLIGKSEWEQSHNTVYRFVGGSQQLADDLALYITRHGGRILTSHRVENITQTADSKFSISGLSFDKVVSTLHPKQLLSLTDLPLFRTITRNRILNTPETAGSFKTYIRLKPDTLPYDSVTHYIPEHKLLVMTPCSEPDQRFARTIETVMPMDYSELAPWHQNRKEHYDQYAAFKHQKEQETLDFIGKIYPNIREQMIDIFSSTSLTYRDDYLSPEGAMFGMSESVGSVRTRVKNFYLSGQNIFLHGLCGTAMTAQLTVQALCEDAQ